MIAEVWGDDNETEDVAGARFSCEKRSFCARFRALYSVWKAFAQQRKAESPAHCREVQLTDDMLTVLPGDGRRAAELDELIEEQAAELAEETRRHNRRHKPS